VNEKSGGNDGLEPANSRGIRDGFLSLKRRFVSHILESLRYNGSIYFSSAELQSQRVRDS